MCVHIYTLHAACSHRQFQNTFACRSARAHLDFCQDATLDQTVHLPAKPSLETRCTEPQQQRATRPVGGFCGTCVRHQRRKASERKQEMNTTGSDESSTQGGQRDDTITKVRRSVMGFGEIVKLQKEA